MTWWMATRPCCAHPGWPQIGYKSGIRRRAPPCWNIGLDRRRSIPVDAYARTRLPELPGSFHVDPRRCMAASGDARQARSRAPLQALDCRRET